MRDLKKNLFAKFFARNPAGAKDLTLRQVISVAGGGGFPKLRQWRQLPVVLSRAEKLRLRFSFLFIFLCFVFVSIWYVATHRADVPAVGGEYTEGLVGEPQFINPLYATLNDVDADLTRLVFSGLLRWDPDTGLENDLASSILLSEDGLTYTIAIKENARFHNGEPVRASDVIFTIGALQDPAYRSPYYAAFRDVQVNQVDDRTVEFKLTKPFSPFLSNLTVGILPETVWNATPPRNAQLARANLEPVGSGPYRFAEFAKDKLGVIHSYTLKRNGDYYGDAPYIEQLTFKFYPDFDTALNALANRNIEGLGYLPQGLTDRVLGDRGLNLLRPFLARETAVFFNQEKNALLKNKDIRQALALAVDKRTIVDELLQGQARLLDAPLLPGMLGELPDPPRLPYDLGVARSLLDAAGLPLVQGNPFRLAQKLKTGEDVAAAKIVVFRLTTVDQDEYVRVAEALRAQWAQIGVQVEIDKIPSDELFSSVIKPRAYELLLTGVDLGIDSDPFPLWHSSQTVGDGYNLAGYLNRKTDALLEEGRSLNHPDERALRYQQFQTLLLADLPAIFLYQSQYAYPLAAKIKNVRIDRLIEPSDRFADVSSWYIKTRKTLK